ncbi:MAG: hypothetical protein KGZ58_08420, partial [Ignavibacteriales bacterium]|nr:hypothetical protein [Ignavibacteriales bacterium]
MPTKHNFSNTIITLVLVTFTTFSLNFAGIINIGRVEYPTILGHNLAWDRYPIEGFAWPSSVKQGENLKLYVSVRNIADTTEQSSGNRNYSINIFRLPDQNTVYWSSANIPGQFFPLHDVNDSSIYPGDYSRKPIEFKKGCMAYWENGAITVSIGSGWPSGLYYAKLRHLSDTTKDFFVPFVVRSANPGTTSKILFKFDFNTFMAYSHFGGGSLYSDKDTLSLTFTDTIATDRPIIGSIDTTRITWKDYKDNYKIFIASLDSLGYEMEYCNNIDIDKNPIENGKEFVANYNMMVIFWHDEYWSQDERTNTEKFKGTNPNGSPSGLHGNIARFAPNTCYWRIHWDTLNGQKNYKKLWCRKSNWPGHHPYDLWRDTQYGPGLPEAKLLGEQFESAWTKGGHEPPDTVYKENHWIFKRTNLYNGDAFGYGWIWDTLRLGIVLGELENTRTGKADFPLDTLAQSWVLGANGLLDLKQMLYYEDTSSNARVFAEGANGWVNGLHPNADHDTDVVRMKKITDNIFSHFSGKKYIGNVYTTFENALKWKTPIELDGNVTILQNKYLRIDTTTITIDSNTHCFIDGKMEINGNVTINGQDNLSSLNVNPTGQLILKANSTLTINNPAVLVMEAGGDVVFEANAKLILNSAVLENGAMLSVESGGTLEIATSEIGFGGAGSSIVSTGGAININEGVTLIVNNGGVFGCLQAGNIQLGENASIVVAEDGNLVWNGNGTWQFGNNSHLEIYGTADVSDNVVLNFPSSSDVTVYEDAQFIMRVNSQINVDGKFVVSGSAERHVTFTLNGRPEELWQGFSFGVETHQSIIDYADITNAEKGISTPYNIDLKITNTTFTNGQIGIYLYTSDKDPAVYGPVYVGNNFISGENVAGIYVDKGSSDVVIKDNTIEGMADWGAGMNFAFSSPQQLT